MKKAAGIRNLSFEQALERLDALVQAMESGEIGIEESIARYEEAMALKAHCQQILDRAEQRIRKIQIDAGGQPQATPFDAAAAPQNDDELQPEDD